MAQIRILTKLDNEQKQNVLQQIYQTCTNEPNLSPRPMRELNEAYQEDRLLFAADGQAVVGWLLRIPYNNNMQELAAGYVVGEYRSRGVFQLLLQKAIIHAPISLIVTFNGPFATYLQQKNDFKRSRFWEAVLLSKGKFLVNRLNISRLMAIKRHYKDSQPIYIIYHHA